MVFGRVDASRTVIIKQCITTNQCRTGISKKKSELNKKNTIFDYMSTKLNSVFSVKHMLRKSQSSKPPSRFVRINNKFCLPSIRRRNTQ